MTPREKKEQIEINTITLINAMKEISAELIKQTVAETLIQTGQQPVALTYREALKRCPEGMKTPFKKRWRKELRLHLLGRKSLFEFDKQGGKTSAITITARSFDAWLLEGKLVDKVEKIMPKSLINPNWKEQPQITNI